MGEESLVTIMASGIDDNMKCVKTISNLFASVLALIFLLAILDALPAIMSNMDREPEDLWFALIGSLYLFLTLGTMSLALLDITKRRIRLCMNSALLLLSIPIFLAGFVDHELFLVMIIIVPAVLNIAELRAGDD